MDKPTKQEVEDLIKYCSDKGRIVPMPPKWVEVMRIIEYEKLEKLYPSLNTEAEMIVNFVSCDGSMGYKLSAAIAAKYPDIKYKFQASCMNDEVKKGE